MSMTEAMLDILVASGTTVEQLVALWKADIAEREAKDSARRVKDACRKREERLLSKPTSMDVHGHDRTAADSKDGGGLQGQAASRAGGITAQGACGFPVGLSNDNPKDIPPLSPKPSRSRGTRLPDGWSPSDDLLAFCHDLGLSPGDTRTLTDEFVDFWRGVPGSRGTKLDWDATFRNRARDAAGKKSRYARGPQGQSVAPPGGVHPHEFERQQQRLREEAAKKFGIAQ